MDALKNNIINISPDSESLHKAIAEDFMRRANQCVREKGVFNLALSGGNTPKKLFSLLSTEPYKSGVPWDKINFFFSDERYVRQNQPDSNFFTARRYLFSQVKVPMVNVFQVPTEYLDLDRAARDYAQTLRDVFNVSSEAIPQFDLLYLGLGSNAHTASLMPSTALVKAYAKAADGGEKAQIVAATGFEGSAVYRITFTPTIINNSKAIVFFVEGAEKAEAVWQILEGPYDPVIYPAQLIKSQRGKVIWFLDQSAAAKLSKGS